MSATCSCPPTKRQFPNGSNAPQWAPTSGTVAASSTAIATTRRSTSISGTPTLTSGTATARSAPTNTVSLLMDPSADTSNISAATATATNRAEEEQFGQSVVTQLFSPDGSLFSVGLIIIGVGAFLLLACAILITRCTLRRRRRARTHSRVRSIAEKPRKKGKTRESEFWSADANRVGRTKFESVMPRTPDEGSNLVRAGTKVPPVRPTRTGEAGIDLQAQGRVHFTPSLMSDYTGLSTDVQHHGSVRGGGAHGGSPVSLLQPATPFGRPEVSDRRVSDAVTLGPDPFASSSPASLPIITSNASTPLPFPESPHSTMLSPYGSRTSISYSHTPNIQPSPSPLQQSSSWDTPSANATPLPSAWDPLNVRGQLEPLNKPPATPSSAQLHTFSPAVSQFDKRRSSVARESVMSDPFAFDNMGTGPSHRPTLTLVPQMELGGMTLQPSPNYGNNTWTSADSGIVPPPSLHIDESSPGIQTAPIPSPYLSSPNTLHSAFRTDASFPAPPPILQTPYQPYPISSAPPTQSTHPGLALQSDVSQALSHLRRRMSDMTVFSSYSYTNAADYRPTLGPIPDHDHETAQPGYPMQDLSESPYGGYRESLSPMPFGGAQYAERVPNGMQYTERVEIFHGQDRGSPIVASPTSLLDGYCQSPGSEPSPGLRSPAGLRTDTTYTIDGSRAGTIGGSRSDTAYTFSGLRADTAYTLSHSPAISDISNVQTPQGSYYAR